MELVKVNHFFGEGMTEKRRMEKISNFIGYEGYKYFISLLSFSFEIVELSSSLQCNYSVDTTVAV